MNAPDHTDVIGVSFRIGETEEWENFPRICCLFRTEFDLGHGVILWALWGMN